MSKKKKIGCYLRVSTKDQDHEPQRQAITDWARMNHIRASALTWYADKSSGATTTTKRPELKRLLADIDDGKIDAVVCYKLDRLSRRAVDGLRLLGELADKEIRVVAVSQNIDFNGSIGKLLSTILLAVAEMERSLISDRQKASIAARKAKGIQVGRKPDFKRRARVHRMREKMSVQDIATRLGISRQSVYQALEKDLR